MKKYIADILGTNEVAKYIFNINTSYPLSSWSTKMSQLISEANKNQRIVLKETEWLFEDYQGRCWGVLGEHVICLNKKTEYKYVCEGFESIYEHYKQNEPEIIEENKQKAIKDNVDYNETLIRYYEHLDDNNIPPSFIVEEEKFSDFLKNHKA